MSRRERVLIVLGIIVAIGLVVYPLAYRLTTEGAGANAHGPVGVATTSASTSTGAARTPVSTSTAIPTERPDPSAFEPDPSPPDMFWGADATAHRGRNGKTFDYECSPNGTFGAIWGTDTYTDDSSVCTAGVHKGVITRERGGTVRIIIRPGLASYVGSTRNGVTTESYDAWDGSFEVVEP